MRPKPLKEEICYAHFPCLIFLAGLAMAALCSLLRLPRIIGMLFTGILLGPYVLGLLDPSILAISADLRQMALIIILIKAGLSLDLGDLRRVGRPAVLMSFLPASFEILAYILFAPMLLGITRLEAAVMGAVLGISFLLVAAEDWLEGILPLSGLLAVMSMACALRLWGVSSVTDRLSEKFGKLWIAAEVLLFVLVGAAVDIRYTLQAGAAAVVMILLALCVRAVGVLLALAGTRLDWKERLFCVIAYLPKATVQAAIGSVPLAMGLPCGALVLSVAVLAILITAPLGAIGIDSTCRRLLRPAG